MVYLYIPRVCVILQALSTHWGFCIAAAI